MRQIAMLAAVVGLSGASLMGASYNSVKGAYVEARTAEVFTGGCVMGSEAETTGKEAVLAWKVDSGNFNGTALDGLSVVAAIAGDKNLGIYEIGGDRAVAKTALFVDERANPAQRLALVAMARDLTGPLMSTIVSVTPAPIQFADKGAEISVSAPNVTLAVGKHLVHDPSCGRSQWFHPLASVDDATMATTEEHAFTGTILGTKWSDPDKASSFFGTFSR